MTFLFYINFLKKNRRWGISKVSCFIFISGNYVIIYKYQYNLNSSHELQRNHAQNPSASCTAPFLCSMFLSVSKFFVRFLISFSPVSSEWIKNFRCILYFPFLKSDHTHHSSTFQPFQKKRIWKQKIFQKLFFWELITFIGKIEIWFASKLTERNTNIVFYNRYRLLLNKFFLRT